MLTVYKASAGSGKTFQLVAEYLKLVIQKPYRYKHILAVTFTNKATGEMKSRILQQLDLLAKNQSSPYLQLLSKQLNLAEQTVVERSQKVLKYLVHDFSRFSISTIDSFTQRIIKSFNREIGISPQFNLELDESIILDEAIDRLLMKMNEDPKLLQWISDYAEEKAQNSLTHKIENDLKELGKELAKERFQLFAQTEERIYERKELINFQKELQKEIGVIEQTLQKIGKQFLESIEDHGYGINDFAYGKNGIANFFVKMYSKIVELPGKRVSTAEENAESWISKTHKDRTTLLHLVEDLWHPMLMNALNYIRKNYELYNSSMLTLKNIRVLGILTDLKHEIQTIMQERGGLQISDSNLLLSKIVGNSDSPFIYEKIGNHFKNFMLDEFQDTSAMQWMNFKPLLTNSMAENNNNLLVGDVKQSIYRFRNSDWNILAEQVQNEFMQFDYLERTLDANWRSEENIVEFNNQIFAELKHNFKQLIENNFEIEAKDNIYIQKLEQVYHNFSQKPGKKSDNKKGYINIRFLEEKNFENESIEKIVEQIKYLQDHGVKAAETAILLRKKSEAVPIINYFLEIAAQENNKKYNFSIISNESLFLSASKGVAFIINIIRYFINPENQINKAALLYSWLKWLRSKSTATKTEQSQYMLDFSTNKDFEWTTDYDQYFKNELEQSIRTVKSKIALNAIDEAIMLISQHFNLFKIPSEIPFLQSLIDQAATIKKQISNDFSSFIDWWEEEGYKTSVNINDNIDAIRIMTVHKSKGLEFEAVILPFLNWQPMWKSNMAPTIWCEPTQPPFNSFAALPIKANKLMAHSYFKDDYFDELFNTYIDTLNLVYVAFTRAKSALIINCLQTKSSNKAQNINKMLQVGLENMVDNAVFTQNWQIEDETHFTYGTLPHLQPQEKEPEAQSNYIQNYVFGDFGDRVQLKISNENFVTIDERNHSKRNLGNVVHQILAEVETLQDIEKACKKVLLNGLVDEKEHEEILSILKKHTATDDTVKKWFDGTYNIMNERTLLTPNQLLRPDRIMIDGKNAIVVDYKWGEKHKKHVTQIKNYAKILKETGFARVTGYLWYLNTNTVENIDTY